MALRTYLRHRQTLVETASTAHAADAESAGADESAAPPRRERYHRRDRPADRARHPRRASGIPQRLAQHRDPRCRATHAEIVAALTGHYRAGAALRLTAARRPLRCLSDADRGSAIRPSTRISQTLTASIDRAARRRCRRRGSRRKTAARITTSRFDVRPPLFHLTRGVDLTARSSLLLTNGPAKVAPGFSPANAGPGRPKGLRHITNTSELRV